MISIDFFGFIFRSPSTASSNTIFPFLKYAIYKSRKKNTRHQLKTIEFFFRVFVHLVHDVSLLKFQEDTNEIHLKTLVAKNASSTLLVATITVGFHRTII